ncbi:hypothetical protein DM01DRAFT_1374481 [Hesseltinella vesiculosa]|uniref:Uncharacterized protein n=1 Tax=Hesseltinella vesiculosa TaxID=101127 RepID=A0A1X2GHC3_9FUNG|nr:hypothetical protein DM01DRAFT_1374481 [Hesseltinella vesiculosa]
MVSIQISATVFTSLLFSCASVPHGCEGFLYGTTLKKEASESPVVHCHTITKFMPLSDPPSTLAIGQSYEKYLAANESEAASIIGYFTSRSTNLPDLTEHDKRTVNNLKRHSCLAIHFTVTINRMSFSASLTGIHRSMPAAFPASSQVPNVYSCIFRKSTGPFERLVADVVLSAQPPLVLQANQIDIPITVHSCVELSSLYTELGLDVSLFHDEHKRLASIHNGFAERLILLELAYQAIAQQIEDLSLITP